VLSSIKMCSKRLSEKKNEYVLHSTGHYGRNYQL
jgi:hypothetical protein